MVDAAMQEEDLLNSEGRQNFWDTLLNAQGFSEGVRDEILNARPKINQLCRFRSVNRNSLNQLRTNTLSFSLPLYYDDPFDTYFYIDKKKLQYKFDTFVQLANNYSIAEITALIQSSTPPVLEPLLNAAASTASGKPPFDFDQIEREIDNVAKIIQNVGYSICFCDSPLNQELWLKYADNHKGFVQIYDLDNPNEFHCSRNNDCNLCVNKNSALAPYPVYYSTKKYNATEYALKLLLLRVIPTKIKIAFPKSIQALEESIRWEFEKVTLIKNKEHEHDCEWRLLCRTAGENRPSAYIKPSSVVLGLKMKPRQKRRVAKAAKVAGIKTIQEAYINESSPQLAFRPYDQ